MARAADPVAQVVKALPSSDAVRFFRRESEDCYLVFERDAYAVADKVSRVPGGFVEPSARRRAQI